MMKLDELNAELTKRGYYTRLDEGQLVVGFPPEEVPDTNGISTIRFCCAATVHANGFELEYELAAYSKYTVVPDAAQALDFITAKFPLQ